MEEEDKKNAKDEMVREFVHEESKSVGEPEGLSADAIKKKKFE